MHNGSGPTLFDLAQITPQEVDQFVSEKITKKDCPACDKKDWVTVFDKEQFLSFVAIPSNGSFNLPPSSIPVFATVCTNCGFARAHVLGVVLSWKLAKGKL